MYHKVTDTVDSKFILGSHTYARITGSQFDRHEQSKDDGPGWKALGTQQLAKLEPFPQGSLSSLSISLVM